MFRGREKLVDKPVILFIDENPADVTLASMTLEKEIPQAEIRFASSALEFGDAIASGGFDVVVLDSQFSWADGSDVQRRLKDRYPDIPIVIFCNRVDARFEAKLFVSGPADFLSKSSSGFLGLPEAVRKATRRAHLRREESSGDARLRLLLERSQMGVFRADWQGRLLEFNSVLARMLGVKTETERPDSVLPLFFRSETQEELRRKVERDGPTRKREIEIAAPGRPPTWVAVTETVSEDDSGNKVIDGLVEDVSHYRKLQQSLKRSNQDLQDFAYVASHELQQPLRMVERFTKILAEEHVQRLDRDGAECVRFANEGARRMQTLVDDLLAFSRISSQTVAFELCDTSELVEKALMNLRPIVEEKRAGVTWSGLPRINADPRQMLQLFQNLIGNAIKFQKGDDNPRVRISSERREGFHYFSVRDNGIGIDPSHLASVFELFKRLDPSYPGSGLGLAICKRIVERHGGRIWAESQLGVGSAFHFKIPVTPTQ